MILIILMMIMASKFGGTAKRLWELDMLRESYISKGMTQTTYVCVTLAFAISVPLF